jgi:hypothetical protein
MSQTVAKIEGPKLSELLRKLQVPAVSDPLENHGPNKAGAPRPRTAGLMPGWKLDRSATPAGMRS